MPPNATPIGAYGQLLRLQAFLPGGAFMLEIAQLRGYTLGSILLGSI